jgi:hypothetical protein
MGDVFTEEVTAEEAEQARQDELESDYSIAEVLEKNGYKVPKGFKELNKKEQQLCIDKGAAWIKTHRRSKNDFPEIVNFVKDGDEVKYLIKTDLGLTIKGYLFDSNNDLVKPKQDLPINYLPPDVLRHTSTKSPTDLFTAVVNYLKQHVELQNDEQYLVVALWIFHTYIIEHFRISPMLYFYGVSGTGKTRMGEVLTSLAYLGQQITSPTEASLFRTATYFGTCYIIDELDLFSDKGRKEVADLLKSRYKRGQGIPRCAPKLIGPDSIIYYNIFGPTVICTTEAMPGIIENRCFVFIMQPNKDDNVKVELDINEAWAEQLRIELTLFRASYLGEDIPDYERVTRRRLGELSQPLYRLLKIVCPDKEKEFRQFVKMVEKEKLDLTQQTLESRIIEVLWKQYDGMTAEAKKNPYIKSTDICNAINRNLSPSEQVYYTKVGEKLKVMGFKSDRIGPQKESVYIMDEMTMRKRYYECFQIDPMAE